MSFRVNRTLKFVTCFRLTLTTGVRKTSLANKLTVNSDAQTMMITQTTIMLTTTTTDLSTQVVMIASLALLVAWLGVQKRRSDKTPRFQVQQAIADIQKWLFLEGGHLSNVESMLTQYCLEVRRLGIPVDRFCYGGVMLHPQLAAYDWTWEWGEPFCECEIPRHVFRKCLESSSTNDPFVLLFTRKQSSVRMRAADGNLPDNNIVDTWYRAKHYQDYFALPSLYRGQVQGGVAWATQHPDGFCQEHIEFFQNTFASLCTVMRLHTNDVVVNTLMGRLREQVKERTRDLESANQNLAEANRQVVRQSHAQLKHFACMSHEIRTPLNCIVGMSSLLLQTELDQEQEESVRMIISSGDLLRGVVDDVLDYSKLESGKVELVVEDTNLRQTCSTVVKSIQLKGRCKNLNVTSNYRSAVPEIYRTDSRRLQQVLYNLLGNALKFSDNGGQIDLTVYVCDETPHPRSQRHLCFSVTDHGKGIKQDDINRIFEPFHQGSSVNEELHGGTGLGLAITSKIVRSLGGSISVQSTVGKGSTFTVKFPYDGPHETSIDLCLPSEHAVISTTEAVVVERDHQSCPSGSATCSTENKSTAKRPLHPSLRASGVPASSSAQMDVKILVAEDNLINQKVLLRMLHRLGIMSVDVVDNGRKAVDRSASEDYDLILLDIEMPVLSGIDASRLIAKRRNKLGNPWPKIVYLTAHALDSFRKEADQAGGDGFISKPCSFQDIKDVIEKYTHYAKGNQDKLLDDSTGVSSSRAGSKS